MAWEDESIRNVTHTCDVVRQGSDDDVDVDERGQLEKPNHGIDCQMPPPISTTSKRTASHPVHMDPTNSSSSTSMSSAAPALDPILVAKALSKVPPFARAGLKKRMEQQLQQQQQQQQQKAVACTGTAEGATGSRSSDSCHSEATSLPSLPLDQEERREMLGSQWEQHRQKVRKASTLQT